MEARIVGGSAIRDKDSANGVGVEECAVARDGMTLTMDVTDVLVARIFMHVFWVKPQEVKKESCNF